jgi:CRISPR-associated protein Cas2
MVYRNQSNQARTGNQVTCYVVAYDIPSDKRRTKIHKILLGYGKWTQYSLFECFLTRKELLLLQTKLAHHLLADQDSVRFYPLCANCVARVETVGGPPPKEDKIYII